jgi:hypothetical protein
MSVDVSYFAFNKTLADKAWEKITDNEISYLVRDFLDSNKEEDRMQTLMLFDLEHGSVQVSPEDGKLIERNLLIFFHVFCPELTITFDPESVLREHFVLLFSRLNEQKLIEALRNPDPRLVNIADLRHCDVDELMYSLVGFANELFPLAREVKNHGARLVIVYGGSPIEDAELRSRAEEHMRFLKEKFPLL